jgi:cytochrome c biogenesis protein CcdA
MPSVEPYATVASGLSIGLALTALALGLRHGVDWDHLAAITDLSATQDQPRRGLVLGTLYAVGHGVVVLAIGTVAIVAGRNLPEGIDRVFGRIVGWSLIVLGAYVAYTLVAHRGEFRMQSRWMLVIRAVRRLIARIRGEGAIEHEHLHVAAEGVHHEGHDPVHREGGRVHSHRHAHGSATRGDEIGSGAALGVGMLHGVGAETPTQVLIFLAAAQAGGLVAGLVVLVVFVAGVLITNTAIVIASVFGFRSASRRRRLQLGLGAVTAVVSLTVGTLFALGLEDVLPEFFAG